MTDAHDWKTTFQSAMYECPELRQKKVHRDLLGFILFKANRKSKSCWVSQKEMARVQGCSIRNIKELLRDLQGIGVLMQVRFSALPLKDQKAINSISPREMSKNSNVYFLSVGWAKDVLDEGRVETPRRGEIRISEDDRNRGRKTSNSRRQRYAPIVLSEVPRSQTVDDHDEWLFLNAVGEKGGTASTPIQTAKGGTPTTGISIEEYQAENAAPNMGQDGSTIPLYSRAKSGTTYRSSLTFQHAKPDQHGYGGGEAIAPVPRTKSLARPEGTEQDAARAPAPERRAS
ncbi:hypothetical protein [Sinorhizobium sp. RAC02]|uniref:hypothetical protein n=1 Tax=Sinorhizobium sp. RAC02 TaxID=1842534 RepID=UPI00083DDEC0|nr:hypothetical protein [Sinorhizobium sp. RAC02]AOF89971.1 hypothetical protein BSY16_3986 [Sinorhizobium sp. RAC02]